MIIYPAVDIRKGRCVRLRKGALQEVTDYGSPLVVAEYYRVEGAQILHVVDLDGAFGTGDNSSLVAAIAAETGLPVQVGGGIRTREQIKGYLEHGVRRVVLGTAALENPALVEWAAAAYPGRIAVGLDARCGRLAVRGWAEQSDVDVFAAARRLKQMGVHSFVYTDIERDGMMAGPDVTGTRHLTQETGADIIASGGISRLEDVAALRDSGASGCIIGRALLDGAFTLPEAVAAGSREC